MPNSKIISEISHETLNQPVIIDNWSLPRFGCLSILWTISELQLTNSASSKNQLKRPKKSPWAAASDWPCSIFNLEGKNGLAFRLNDNLPPTHSLDLSTSPLFLNPPLKTKPTILDTRRLPHHPRKRLQQRRIVFHRTRPHARIRPLVSRASGYLVATQFLLLHDPDHSRQSGEPTAGAGHRTNSP